MKRLIVRRVAGQRRLEAALIRRSTGRAPQWIAWEMDAPFIGTGDTIEEACDALAVDPQLVEPDDEPSQGEHRSIARSFFQVASQLSFSF